MITIIIIVALTFYGAFVLLILCLCKAAKNADEDYPDAE